MIIKLKGASFSEAVTIGTEVQYDSNVDNLFVNGYLKSASKKQKVALSSFLSNLHTENLWNKITGMYIPILGMSVTDALLNVKNSYGSNNTLDSYPDGALEIDTDNKGIKGTGNIIFGDNWPDSTWYSTSVNPSDFHQCVVAKDYKPVDNQVGFNISSIKKDRYGQILPFKVVAKSMNSNTLDIAGIEKQVSLQVPAIVSLTSEKNILYNGDGSYYEGTESHDNLNCQIYPFFNGIYAVNNGNTLTAMQGLKFMSFGKSMTKEEMQKYYALVKTLVDNLLEL